MAITLERPESPYILNADMEHDFSRLASELFPGSNSEQSYAEIVLWNIFDSICLGDTALPSEVGIDQVEDWILSRVVKEVLFLYPVHRSQSYYSASDIGVKNG